MIRRRHFLIVALVFIITLILGSNFDFLINKNLFDRYNGFGVFIAAFGIIPGYGLISLLAGAFYRIVKNQNFFKWFKVLLIIASFIGIPVAAYFMGQDIFSVNGYNVPIGGSKFTTLLVSTAICLLPSFGLYALGYYLGKNIKNKNAWIGIILLIICMIIALVPGITLIKDIFHRPRYRILVNSDENLFRQWWQTFPEYGSYNDKEILGELVTKEEFKSFPSGHAAVSMLMPFFLAFLSISCPKLKKYKIPLFYIGFAYCLLVSYTRMRIGAHYLSDVSIGGLITIFFMFLGNEIILRYKLFDEEHIEENRLTLKVSIK